MRMHEVNHDCAGGNEGDEGKGTTDEGRRWWKECPGLVLLGRDLWGPALACFLGVGPCDFAGRSSGKGREGGSTCYGRRRRRSEEAEAEVEDEVTGMRDAC